MKNKNQNLENNYEVIFLPSSKQLDEIEKWLKDENKKTNEGFYCNWEIIKSSFCDKNIVTISNNKKTIGFAIWRITTDKTARIEIAEIKPSHRKKGFGRKLINHLIDFLKNKNIYVIGLHCAPTSSKPIWEKLGFIEFPDSQKDNKFNSNCKNKLYKILVDNLNQSFVQDNDETIELWHDEPYRIDKDTQPTFIWNLKFNNESRKLSIPIIQPASYEWRIRWSKYCITIKDDKVKRFSTEIHYDSFIIICELPNIKIY